MTTKKEYREAKRKLTESEFMELLKAKCERFGIYLDELPERDYQTDYNNGMTTGEVLQLILPNEYLYSKLNK